jgi:hypothetical protein
MVGNTFSIAVLSTDIAVLIAAVAFCSTASSLINVSQFSFTV